MALPAQIDPRKLALQAALLEGHVDSSELDRLSSSVNRVVGPCAASIQFEIDKLGQPFARGTACVEVELTCQRCLDPLMINLQANFSLQIIGSDDQIVNVPPHHEPWVVADRMVNLITMVEDEVLLALPMVNYHRVEDCTGSALSAGSDSSGLAMAKNPFSILEQLKKH